MNSQSMGRQQISSFAEVTFIEAIARRIRVDLIIKPIAPGSDSRLRSRFLGAYPKDRIILEVPQARRHKVFVPVGWDAGMAFSMGQFLLQARTTVLDHCQFQLYPTRRIDGLIVQRPTRIISLNRRSHPRHEVDPSAHVTMTSIWSAEDLARGDKTASHSGQLSNWSVGGLGIRLSANLPYSPGTQVIVRLDQAGCDECPIFRAVLKHCTLQKNGEWIAGFGEMVKIEPGQAVKTIESLTEPQV